MWRSRVGAHTVEKSPIVWTAAVNWSRLAKLLIRRKNMIVWTGPYRVFLQWSCSVMLESNLCPWNSRLWAAYEVRKLTDDWSLPLSGPQQCVGQYRRILQLCSLVFVSPITTSAENMNDYGVWVHCLLVCRKLFVGSSFATRRPPPFTSSVISCWNGSCLNPWENLSFVCVCVRIHCLSISSILLWFSHQVWNVGMEGRAWRE